MEENLSSPTTYNGHHYQLDNLPILIYPYLFNHLQIVDLLKLKSVSKSFYSIVNDCNIYQLTFNYDQIFVKDNWFSTTKPIQLRYQINTSKIDVLKNPPDYLLNLRYLKIWLSSDLLFSLNDLNKFTKLQILDVRAYINEKSNLLQFPNLKALSIRLDIVADKLVIDAPNLHSLYLGHNLNIDEIEFYHPLSVKYLRVSRCTNRLLMFENLECLELLSHNFTESDLNVISRFKNLKKFRYWLLSNYYRLKEPTDELKKLIRLKEDGLVVVFQGVKLKRADQLDECERAKSILEYQLNNYGDLDDDLNFVIDVNYNKLINVLPDGQPADLFKKYNNIKSLTVHERIEDENRLINFIRGCNNLVDLSIYEPSLVSQQFYDQLPVISSLNRFSIREVDINFKFLKKMINITELEVDIRALEDEDFNLNDLKCLRIVRFFVDNNNYDNHEIEIYKDGESDFMVTDNIPGTSNKNFSSLKVSIEYVRELKDKDKKMCILRNMIKFKSYFNFKLLS